MSNQQRASKQTVGKKGKVADNHVHHMLSGMCSDRGEQLDCRGGLAGAKP